MGSRSGSLPAETEPPTLFLAMGAPLTAEDLWPLVQKLPHDEQVRLAKLALMAAARGPGADADAYRATPPAADEFSSDEDLLSWEGEGWEELDAPR
jgi:hypothetical protein